MTALSGDLHLSLSEYTDLNVLGPAAQILRVASSGVEAISTTVVALPDSNVDLHYWGIGAHAEIAGGKKLKAGTDSAASVLKSVATMGEIAASYVNKAASYERRRDDWILQFNLAARELMHIGHQLIVSAIAEQVAYHEYQVTDKQLKNAKAVDDALHEKFSSEQLYTWMQGEISRLYYEYYRFAFDIARKAEQTMRHELMRPEIESKDFIKFNYWDSGRKGLLSGEALYLDIKQMERAYNENSKREYELTKHISLRQLSPIQFLSLLETGSGEFTIAEWLYAIGGPSQYMLRIKSVGLSIPSVSGPYTSVNCTLSLLRSTVRKSPVLKDGEYRRTTNEEDDRFVDYYGTVESVVTSSGTNDSGLFETTLRDERFLPFEGAGAISTWRVELPS